MHVVDATKMHRRQLLLKTELLILVNTSIFDFPTLLIAAHLKAAGSFRFFVDRCVFFLLRMKKRDEHLSLKEVEAKHFRNLKITLFGTDRSPPFLANVSATTVFS